MFERIDPAVTADQREAELVALETVINRARHRQAELIRGADSDQSATSDGCRTLVEWVIGRLDTDVHTARGLVTLARYRRPEPTVDDEQSDVHVSGSFARTVATRRLEASGAGSDLLSLSLGMDVAGVEAAAARRRHITAAQERESWEGRYLYLQPSLDQTHWRVRGRLEGVDGAAVSQILDETADTYPALPDGTREDRSARRADALVHHVTTTNGNDGDPSDELADESRAGPAAQVTVFVDADPAAVTNGEAGAWIPGGTRVGPDTLERLLCEATISVIARTQDGTPLTIGSTTTAITPAVRRFVLHRDGGMCTADGCTSRYRLQPHHITPRAHGGTNRHDNLTSLCWFHHHVVVHRRGYTIDPTSPPGRRRFLPPPERAPPD